MFDAKWTDLTETQKRAVFEEHEIGMVAAMKDEYETEGRDTPLPKSIATERGLDAVQNTLQNLLG